MKITRTSLLSGIEHTKDLPISQKQLDDFNSGMKIQNVFPELDAYQREFILTGMLKKEWDEAFPEENE
jgi:hypothetical protein